MTINKRNEWIFGCVDNTRLADKATLVNQEILRMLNKTTRIFKYSNLPDTIPQKDLETILQVGGFAVFGKDPKGVLYAYTAGLGGEPNPYYLPTIATVANPALKFSKMYNIDQDCVVMRNDNYYQGLMPLFNKYAYLLVEAEISLKYALYNTRIPALIQADNDNTKASAEQFLKKIVDGEDIGVIASKEFFDGIKTQDYVKSSYVKDLVEAIQYIRGSWYNEIGIKAQYNMKREAISEAETSLSDDVIYPMIDTMLECRREGLEKINAMFGLDITVELASIWAQNREEVDLDLKLKESEIKENTEESETDGEIETGVIDDET